MIRSLSLGLVLLALFATSVRAAAPATKPATPLASVRPEAWAADNDRLKAQVSRLAATVAELEKRPAPATRPASATAPTSRPVAQLIAENRRLVGAVNGLLERIARTKDQPPLSKGVSEINISFTCEGHTVDEIGELLGVSGQLASQQDDGKLQYEWQFKILDDGGHRIAAIQPWMCEVVDGKIVRNQMLERRQLGASARPNATPAAKPSRR